jgi:hypothetical protein
MVGILIWDLEIEPDYYLILFPSTTVIALMP